MNSRRRFALIMCLGMALVLIVSSAFLIHEADHECIGEGCEVCAHIAAAAGLLRSFVLLGAALLVLFSAWLAMHRYAAYFRNGVYRTPTLIGWKVRLNN